MKHLKKWYWQLLIVGPWLPWLYLHYIDWNYRTAQGFGWGNDEAGFVTVFLTMGMTVIVGLGFGGVHSDDD